MPSSARGRGPTPRGKGQRSYRPNSTAPGCRGGGGYSVTEERDSDRELEALKMYQDNFKTLMTFSSGALVVVATVVGAFWPKPEHLWVLAVSLAFFLFGTAVALWGLVSVQRHVNDPENQNKFYLH